jgi:hypothetical protein
MKKRRDSTDSRGKEKNRWDERIRGLGFRSIWFHSCVIIAGDRSPISDYGERVKFEHVYIKKLVFSA